MKYATLILKVIGVVLVAIISFYLGAYWTMTGGRLLHPPGVGSDTIAGIVVSHTDQSFTIKTGDGSTKELTLAPNAQVLLVPVPIRKTLSDLEAGFPVNVVIQGGQAELVQFVSPTATVQ